MDSDRLVEVGVNLISKFGARALSLTSVARQAGVARATAYRMFGGRDALVDAIVERELTCLKEYLVAWGADAPDVRTRIHTRFVNGLQYMRTHEALQYVLVNEPDVLVGSLVTGDDLESPSLIERVVDAVLPELGEDEVQQLYPDARGGVEFMVRTAYSCMLMPKSAMSDSEIADLVVRAIVR